VALSATSYSSFNLIICSIPVNGLSSSQRRQQIKNGLPALLDEVARISPEYIVVVKKGDMERIVFRSVCDKFGYIDKKTAHNLPFPACGNQKNIETSFQQ
jgi:hypothetical protein